MNFNDPMAIDSNIALVFRSVPQFCDVSASSAVKSIFSYNLLLAISSSEESSRMSAQSESIHVTVSSSWQLS